MTGRTQAAGESALGGTIHDAAAAVTAAGAKGVAVRVDHRDDAETAALLERVRDDEGRLDILVNNAALIHDKLQRPVPFWEKPLSASVDLLDVGLRGSLVASYYAAPLLVETGRDWSGPGGVHLGARCRALPVRSGLRRAQRPAWTSSPPTWRSTSVRVFDAKGEPYGALADPADVAEEALDHLADGPTWIYGSKDPTEGSPLGPLSRRDAVLAMSRGASASEENVKP